MLGGDRFLENKPCPFCGHLPLSRLNYGFEEVKCSNEACRISAKGWLARKFWNSRPCEDALRDEIADLVYRNLAAQTRGLRARIELDERIERLEQELAKTP